MLSLVAKIRKDFGKKIKTFRKKGILPGILYGPKTKNLALELDLQEFEKIYQISGESSLISLEIEGPEGPRPQVGGGAYGAGKKIPVLIHEVQLEPLTSKPIHVDFYQPSLEEEVIVKVPIIFEGEAQACKELGGTLVKNISEVEIKALPQKLPHEIKINVSQLKTFEDNISIKDLKLPEGVKILKESEAILAFVASPEKVEEELVKPVEEKVEEVEKVEKKKVEEEKGEVKQVKEEKEE